MEATMRKLQKNYRRARAEMERWDELQSRLLSQFGNASSIIDRLQVLGEVKNYGQLRHVPGLREELLGKQLKSLEMILCSMRETLKDFHGIVKSLDKIERDSNQLLKGGPALTAQQIQSHVGIWPSFSDCIDGLRSICEMHQSEYALKYSIVASLTLKCRQVRQPHTLLAIYEYCKFFH